MSRANTGPGGAAGVCVSPTGPTDTDTDTDFTAMDKQDTGEGSVLDNSNTNRSIPRVRDLKCLVTSSPDRINFRDGLR